mmetsp:Transcript_6598/g.13662  ORF Transcript_6598/g.13662 Transcript_6598/m.13662 type:complete len:211 (-) Transcript_6598:225-857(-)
MQQPLAPPTPPGASLSAHCTSARLSGPPPADGPATKPAAPARQVTVRWPEPLVAPRRLARLRVHQHHRPPPPSQPPVLPPLPRVRVWAGWLDLDRFAARGAAYLSHGVRQVRRQHFRDGYWQRERWPSHARRLWQPHPPVWPCQRQQQPLAPSPSASPPPPLTPLLSLHPRLPTRPSRSREPPLPPPLHPTLLSPCHSSLPPPPTLPLPP